MTASTSNLVYQNVAELHQPLNLKGKLSCMEIRKINFPATKFNVPVHVFSTYFVNIFAIANP